MCSEQEESVEHVLLRCTAYRSEREQLWNQSGGLVKDGDAWMKKRK